MMQTDYVIRVRAVNKLYQLYDRPEDRLKQFVWRGRRKYFRDFSALHNVSFDMQKGHTVGIIGRNGSGKSTLLQIIAGTLTPTSGSVEVKGRVAALLELGSGFSPDFTGRENVLLNAAVLGLTPEEISERFDDIVRFAQIGDFLDQPVKTYSTGMMMRLAFSVAVCVEPDVLIVDEALSVGDAAFQIKCIQRIEELSKSGVTIIFVSHGLGTVKSMCDQVIYLRNGCVREIGNPGHVIETYMMDLREDQRIEAGSAAEIRRKQSLLSDQAIAFGTDQGRITDVSFVENDAVSTVVSPGDSIHVRVGVEFDSMTKNPDVALLIQNSRSLTLSGTTVGLTVGVAESGLLKRTVEFSFRADFSPGQWFLTLVLRERLDAVTIIPVDKQVAALSIEVSDLPEREHVGFVDMHITSREVQPGLREVPTA
jgi:lipopolysaccharide transport system ATP-binding protein